MDKRKNNGGHSNGGRKSKAEEHKLIESLTPMHKDAIEALEKCVKDKQGWAVKLFFEYMYGKPKQQIEQTTVVLDKEISQEDIKAIKDEFLKKY
jgi:hypothetical protein